MNRLYGRMIGCKAVRLQKFVKDANHLFNDLSGTCGMIFVNRHGFLGESPGTEHPHPRHGINLLPFAGKDS
jgi:hypothetical protein